MDTNIYIQLTVQKLTIIYVYNKSNKTKHTDKYNLNIYKINNKIEILTENNTNNTIYAIVQQLQFPLILKIQLNLMMKI